MSGGWIGVDLDGTLAVHEKWVDHTFIGEPIPEMVDRVRAWRAEGKEVRIFTARLYPLMYVEPSWHPSEYKLPDSGLAISAARRVMAVEAARCIQAWCEVHLGEILPITCVKDYGMIELWDDRAVQVERNTGVVLGKSFERPLSKGD